MPRLKKAVKFASFKELSGQEKNVKFVESRPDGTAEFFRQGKSGGWRDVLTAAQVARFIETEGDMMIQLGYLGEDGKTVLS